MEKKKQKQPKGKRGRREKTFPKEPLRKGQKKSKKK